jgi:hypothetical protein
MNAPTIAVLIDDLHAAEEALRNASSARQRRAMERRLLNRGAALHERLEDAATWLHNAWEGGKDATWLAALVKYQNGYNALSQVDFGPVTQQHSGDGRDDTRSRFRGRPRAVRKSEAQPQGQRPQSAESRRADAVQAPRPRAEQPGLF